MLKFSLKFYSCLALIALLTGCAVDVSLEDIRSKINPPEVEILNRSEPDFLQGEIVTTSAGVQVTGVFGEISEKKQVPGYSIEGVFYE